MFIPPGPLGPLGLRNHQDNNNKNTLVFTASLK